MRPQPHSDDAEHRGSGKLQGKVAIITGGDSGIGRAVAIAYAKEGADVAIAYLNEHEDAKETQRVVEKYGRRCLAIPGDLGQESFCREVVEKTVQEFGKLDILVNNAAEQHPQEDIRRISEEQLERTFRTNVFSFFFLTKAALDHLPEGGAIVNCSSVTAYRGSGKLLDYSSTKGAIVAFTRSLSESLAPKKIRVNGVAPGPIWTPLQVSGGATMSKLETFGGSTPMGRPGQPVELASIYVQLAALDASYATGQVYGSAGGGGQP